MPAQPRYADLFQAIGGEWRLYALDLAVADAAEDGSAYSIQVEIDRLDAYAERHRLERFHLYGHSAGGGVALAYMAAHADRVASLTLDEPATDFSDADLARPEWGEMQGILDRSFSDGMLMFRRLQVGATVSSALPSIPPTWMSPGPRRIALFSRAVPRHRIRAGAYAAFGGPVSYTLGSLTHPRYLATRDRLAGEFRDFQSETFAGLHHLHSAHQALPERVAASLKQLWNRA
jgi:pimeloyl-ACP methyl ester carboxylesterase